MAETLYRSGFGYDVHRLEKDQRLILGGVEIPSDGVGTVAHSDGDVLVHAICDALLGGAGLADIGTYFPDTDPAYRNADSMNLLNEVVSLVSKEGCEIVNLDCTVVLERPKLAPHRADMIEALQVALGLPDGRVSVKATTHEELGPLGAGTGIAAYATVMLRQSSP